jgi:hypothetical protein
MRRIVNDAQNTSTPKELKGIFDSKESEDLSFMFCTDSAEETPIFRSTAAQLVKKFCAYLILCG